MEIRLESHIPEVMKMMKDVAMERMHEAVNLVRNTTVEKLSGERSGRQYKVPGTNKVYTASAPGEPPAVRLGELRQHVGAEVEWNIASQQPVGKVGVPKIKTPDGKEEDYGKMLEIGTKKMAARPWLEPSFRESEDGVVEIFERPWEDTDDNA